MHQLGNEPLLLLQQRKQQVFLLNLLVVPTACHLLGILYGFYAFLGELVEVHKLILLAVDSGGLYGDILPPQIVKIKPLDR